MSLKREFRLRKRSQYLKTYSNGKKFITTCLVIYFLNSRESKKFGFTVSKKIGKAVKRNKIRRMLKEIVRKNLNCFPDNVWYVFNTKRIAKNAEFSDFEKDINNFLKWLNEKNSNCSN